MEEASLSPHTMVLVLTLAGLAVATAALFPLNDVARLSPRPNLRLAWRLLSATIVLCIALQACALVAKMREGADLSDVAAAVVHLLGPAFVFAVAWLSKRTAGDILTMAGFERDASLDVLTGLPNRRSFEASMDKWTGPLGQLRALHLFLLDLDHFKKINDTYGHRAGDMVLRRVGALIAAHIHAPAVAFRIGGEEFAVIVVDADAETAMRAVDQLRRDMERVAFPLPDGETTHVTASVGMATLAATDSAEAVLQRADVALYQAKHSGRNRLRSAA